MGSLKRSVVDFICAFTAFSIILVSIALVSGESFSEGVLVVDKENKSIELFGTSLELQTKALTSAEKLVKFNDNIFGNRFSSVIGNAVEFTVSYLGDFLKIAFGLAKRAVGAA